METIPAISALSQELARAIKALEDALANDDASGAASALSRLTLESSVVGTRLRLSLGERVHNETTPAQETR